MKTILIMRHGEATPMQADDASRNLTSVGQQQAEKMGLWLQATHTPTALLVSPYIRAQQTAEGVKKHNAFLFEETCSDIIPEGNPQIAADYLETLIAMHPQCDTWLVVAHMPIVSYLVDQLSAGNMPIFNTGAVAVLSYDESRHKSQYLSIHAPNNVAV
ncbi:phosphohistidine phosphatase SixA [Pseudoalteromonas sp. SR44-5]|jgi:phosphohistidine phosphatase|nr:MULTISPECIES: phosphohistidine phosphatase SixA [Pseudoalteromonas]MBB1334479.1 phosphohistidine phosphatase SixA [Pseudoalteromonas sp. SR41-6]MBB1342369.1 phosphohistidine phosphatase SixA [Pseudoalteromonas sp. SR45-6]MBB1367421.1 phosphohistidine phosphatase SixA [Pseudoalteromonas sp. SR44-5]MBB1418309.1 phosphohistidine phosphatase SixA [Pseudoalteromonas sp. SG44-1]MBB1422722.1 phosphohistidine phosphatase SixA [Pseudoalteromonas sp. SG43-7]|tara:strand:- start:24092 stop:24568 length:477 start_codon:yes stop_codon:yes gene_type:complete